MSIKVLPPDTAMKIAAGEVIERPASVVKELIENSIDAGAKNIRVEIKNGGLNYLRVSDDGAGVPFAEVPVAFERHATSKINEAEDLYKLHTLGFRGEALPSIAAVSQMTMLTRPRNSGVKAGDEVEAGSEFAIEGGKQVYHRAAGAPSGTIITVRNLFFNLPARQKWSRSGTSEAGHILNIINNYALAYPEIKFSLVSEGRLLLQTGGNGDLKDAIAKIFGSEASAATLPVETHPPKVDNDGVIGETSAEGVRVYGLTAEPGYSKPNRNFMLFFVNRRWVVSRTLSYAVQEAYHSLLMTGRYPVSVLLIEVDPSEVDANVHPAKTEVRFLHERQVFAAVQKAVRDALVKAAGGAVWDAPNPAVFTTPTSRLLDKLYAPSIQTDKISAVSETLALDTAEPEIFSGEEEQQATLDLPGSDNPALALDGLAPPPTVAPPAPAPAMKKRLPLLRVLGQMSATYIVAEGPDGMYLIDQHAAHERVLYEHFVARLQGRDLDRQLLLEPLLLDLAPRQRLLLQEEGRRVELVALGFDLVEDDLAWWLKSVPAALMGRDLKLGFLEMLDEAEGVRDGGCGPHPGEEVGDVPRTWRDKLAASLACHSAVRAGKILTIEEMRELITQLERSSMPNACAHGRPTMIHLSQGQLEKGFGRK